MKNRTIRWPAAGLSGVALVGALTLSVSAQVREVWTSGYREGMLAALRLDDQDNLYLTSQDSGDFVTLKYSASGSLVWSNRCVGGSAIGGGSVLTDTEGQTWVTRATRITNGVVRNPAVIFKYGASGELAWTRQFQTNVLSAALAMDAAGNAYVGGLLATWSFYVVKCSPEGSPLWERCYEPTGNWYVDLNGFSLGPANELLLAGVTYRPDYASPRQALIQYDEAGRLLWSSENTPIPRGYRPAVAADGRGNTFVSAKSFSAAQFGPGGAPGWTKTRSGSRAGFDFSTAQIDPAGNLVIAGTDAFYYTLCHDCGDSGYDYDLTLTKMDPAGVVLWSERSHPDYGGGRLQFDGDGSCYLGGTYSSYSDDDDVRRTGIVVAKYGPNGALLWRTNYSSGRLAGMEVDRRGTLYLVVQDGPGTEVRKLVQLPGPPDVFRQPESRAILDGDSITFSVGGAGFPSPVFQWSFNGLVLPGETNDTLNLAAAGKDRAGAYTAVLSNRWGAVTSAVATLAVDFAPPTVAVWVGTGETQVLAGAAVTLCAQSTGGPKPTLQWRFNGAALPGETNACLALSEVQIGQSGTYSIVASNGLGTDTALVSLTVTPVVIYDQGATQSVAVGTCINFSSAVALAVPYTLQWQFNGRALAGENHPWLSRCLLSPNEAGNYALVVSHAAGSYTSAPIELTLYYAPPTNPSPYFLSGREAALVGEDLSLAAAYNGSPGFIQWRFNGATLPGETNRALPLLAVAPNQAGHYSFVVTNLAGAATSSVATVTVSYQSPIFQTQPASQSVVEGTKARMAASAAAGPPPVYFLEHNGVEVAVPFTHEGCCSEGGFSLIETTLADAGGYRIIASNFLGTAASSVAALTITPAGPLDRWAQRNPRPQSEPLLAVAHGPDQFVAVGARGAILTSSDGTEWALQNRRADVTLNGLAYGAGLFVAVGEGGTVLSSPDGTNWSFRFTAAGTTLRAVTWSAGRFVAVGGAPGVTTLVMHSSDGLSWSRIPLNSFSAGQSVTAGNGVFVAAGSASVLRSPDGIIWELALDVRAPVECVTYANGQFVAVGDDGLVLVSADGAVWQERPPVTARRLLGVTHGAGRFVAAGARGVVLASADAKTWAVVSSGTPDRLESIDFSKGTFVAVGENGTILTSTNGTAWAAQNFGVTRDLDGMDVANGLLVVVGKGGTILTSTNGLTFASQNAGVTNDLHGVHWGGGLWVAVGEPGIVLTSTNAVNWAVRTTGTTHSLKDATYATNQWIVVGTEGTIVRSTDGLNWTATSTGPPYDLNDVAYGNGLFLVAGDGPGSSNGSLFSSVDGVCWRQAEFYPGKNMRGITFANGQFLIAANDGAIFTTTNGFTFATRSVSSENLRAAAWAQGLWIVVGNDGTILTSPDSLQWTRRASRTFENQHQVALLDGKFVVVGNRGGILQSGRFGAELEPPVLTGGGGFRWPFKGVIDQVYQVQASTNLVDWDGLWTFTNRSEHGEFFDPNGWRWSRRFYRLTLP